MVRYGVVTVNQPPALAPHPFDESAFAHAICISVDVEWCHPEVLADTVALLDDAGVRGTFFCTHAGIDAGAHERALHPNYRVRGDTVRGIVHGAGVDRWSLDDVDLFRQVLAATRTFCPEAVGARSHSLLYDTALLPLYAELGLEYDSSYMLPLCSGLAPFWKESGIVEIPLYHMDHWELLAPLTGFAVDRLGLERPGLKVLDFHPNLVFTNVASQSDYEESRSVYHQPAALRARRRDGAGARRLLEGVLDRVARDRIPVLTLAEVNARMRGR